MATEPPTEPPTDDDDKPSRARLGLLLLALVGVAGLAARRLGPTLLYSLRHKAPVVVPHENVAVAMAHGYTMMTGRPQAVMVHVGLGTANALKGLPIAGVAGDQPHRLISLKTGIRAAGKPGNRSRPVDRRCGEAVWAEPLEVPVP